MSRITIVAALAFGSFLLTGCQSLADVVEAHGRGEGTTQTYDLSKDDAWRVSYAALRWNGADAIEEHKEDGYMLTSTGMGMFTYGTVMGVWIRSTDPGHSEVSVITKRRVATNMITDLTENGFHDDFRRGMALVRAGQTLPASRPDDRPAAQP